MVLGTTVDLVLGGCVLFALVVGFASLIAVSLRHRTNTRSPRLHIGLGAPLDQPIPAPRPIEPPVLDESSAAPPVSDPPLDVAIVVDAADHDSADSAVVADGLDEIEFAEGVTAHGAEFDVPLSEGNAHIFAADDSADDIQVVPDIPHARNVAGDTLADDAGPMAADSDRALPPAQFDGSETELAEMRLALEASQAELTHLTASREHALSVVAEFELLIAQLRQEAGQRESQHAQQQEALATQVADIREQSAALETELERTRAQLETTAEQLVTRGSTSEEHLEQTESQHAATFEMQELLGQYEATQASLHREKLDLATQVRDWRQKSERLETELERVQQESAAAQQAAPTSPPDSTDTSQQLNELHATHQQAVADLSLANESVKQLNQQLMLRDVAFSRLEHENQQLARQLADHNDKLEQQVDELRENLKKETGQFEQAAKKLRDTANEQRKQLGQCDARLEDVAVKLSKARGEVVSLNSQLHEHKALVRALRADQETQGHPIENGQPAPLLARKRPTKTHRATRMRTDAELGQLYNHPPDEADDLQQINGIGPVLEKRLNEIGVYRYAQLEEWTNSVVEHMDEQLALRGRIVRDRWVQQARTLSK